MLIAVCFGSRSNHHPHHHQHLSNPGSGGSGFLARRGNPIRFSSAANESDAEISFAQGRALMPKSCKELPLQSLTCEQSTCFKFLDGLDELNIIGDFSPESKANLILDNWGETHVDHFGCINQILAIARDGGYVWGQENLPPPPNCTHAVSQLPHCSEFDCQNYISLYREYSEQGRHYSRSRVRKKIIM